MMSDISSKCVMKGLNADTFIGMRRREESRKCGFSYLMVLIFFQLKNIELRTFTVRGQRVKRVSRWM